MTTAAAFTAPATPTKTGTPTIIRGTRLVAGDKVFFIEGRVGSSGDVLGEGPGPKIGERTVRATNGVSFAFTRGTLSQGTGAYNYIPRPEEYLVSRGEAESAFRSAIDERLPYAESKLAEAECSIQRAIEWRDRLADRVAQLRAEGPVSAVTANPEDR